MKTDVTNEPVPEGREEVARACAELRAFRNGGSFATFGAKVGASGPQWWAWERCFLKGYPRPGETFREKLYIVTGIAPWRWRTREEQQEINDLRATATAEQERAASASPDEGGAS